MNKENCTLKLVDEIILYYNARSKNIKFHNFLLHKMIVKKDKLFKFYNIINYEY